MSMRKAHLTLCSLCIAVTSFSQIPNSGFESWTIFGNYSDPDQWKTLNALTNFDNVYTCTKGAPGNPGASYLMLRSETVTGLGAVPGIAATGTINTTNYSVQGGLPFTLRPQNLTGNWQYMSYTGIDFGFIAVYLTKWNTTMNTRDTISATVYSLTGMAMIWSSFSLALNYQMGTYPDSAQIVLSASAMTNPSAGDYLYIDNLAFSGSVAGIDNDDFSINLNLFPNPATDFLNISYENLLNENIQIELMDVLGNRIPTLFSNPDASGLIQQSLDVRKIEKGVYWIRISDGLRSISRKVVLI